MVFVGENDAKYRRPNPFFQRQTNKLIWTESASASCESFALTKFRRQHCVAVSADEKEVCSWRGTVACITDSAVLSHIFWGFPARSEHLKNADCSIPVRGRSQRHKAQNKAKQVWRCFYKPIKVFSWTRDENKLHKLFYKGTIPLYSYKAMAKKMFCSHVNRTCITMFVNVMYSKILILSRFST